MDCCSLSPVSYTEITSDLFSADLFYRSQSTESSLFRRVPSTSEVIETPCPQASLMPAPWNCLFRVPAPSRASCLAGVRLIANGVPKRAKKSEPRPRSTWTNGCLLGAEFEV